MNSPTVSISTPTVPLELTQESHEHCSFWVRNGVQASMSSFALYVYIEHLRDQFLPVRKHSLIKEISQFKDGEALWCQGPAIPGTCADVDSIGGARPSTSLW